MVVAEAAVEAAGEAEAVAVEAAVDLVSGFSCYAFGICRFS